MTPAARERVRHLKSEVSTQKSRLLDTLRELEALGARREARGLDAVIARLEAWQNR